MEKARELIVNALLCTGKGSGIETLLRELSEHYADLHERPITAITSKGVAFSDHSGIRVEPQRFLPSEGLRRIRYQTYALGRRAAGATLLTTDSKAPAVLPRSAALLPIITDLALYRLPETYRRERVLLWRAQYKSLVRRADAFAAISEFTRREMIELLGIPAEKIAVVPCAAPRAFRHPPERSDARALVSNTYALDMPYLLFVGNQNPRKNLERLLCAFDRAVDASHLPHRLVLCGGRGWRTDLKSTLSSLRHAERILDLDYVPLADLPALYAAADGFLFPSLYEGFGIPVLEAQKCACPVLTSRLSALPEVGGDSVYYVNPYDVRSIASGITELCLSSALRSELIEQGKRNHERYSWSRSAEALSCALAMAERSHH